MNTYDHLDEKTKGLMELPGAQRAHHMLIERFFTHDRLTPIFEHIEFLRFSPPQTRAAGLVVSGPPGSGKSMLASAVTRRYGPQMSDGVRAATLPVLSISMTNAREAKTLYSRMLMSLGVPDPARYVGSDRERRALELCRAAGVRLLVVDEIQDVLTSTPRQQRIALDTLKFLMNELSLPIVALGTAHAPDAMQVDEHLNARMRYRALPVWENDAVLANFLDAFERVLPLKLPSHLASPAIAKVLLRISKGELSSLVKCLCFAAAHAATDGVERILPAALETALDRPPVQALRAMRAAEAAAPPAQEAA
jgi:hypothetical protein